MYIRFAGILVAFGLVLGCVGVPELTIAGVRVGLVEVEDPGFDTVFLGARLALSPDGKHLYFASSSNFGTTADRVAVFDRDPVTGALTEVQRLGPVPGVLMIPSDILVSPDGAHVYIASWCWDAISPLCLEPGEDDLAIALFDRDPVTGHLTFVDAVDRSDGLTGQSIAMSPDGAHIYGEPTVFERDPVTGELTPVQQVVPTLGGHREVSPDGAHVYSIAAPFTLRVFSRNAATGELTFVQDVQIASGHPLQGLRDLAVAPDGAHVYAVERTDAVSVRAYDRDAATGELRLVQSLKGAQPGVEGATFATAITASADGDNVYLGGQVYFGSQVLGVYSRDAISGRLEISDSFIDSETNYFFSRIAVGPGDAHIYIALDSGSIVVLEVLPSPCAPAPLSGCRTPVVPGRAKIDLRNDVPDTRDRAIWKWAKGEATPDVAFGDPESTTDYTLCVYDGSASLVLSTRAPSGDECPSNPCWNVKAGRSVKYKDPIKSPDGILKMSMKPGEEGRPKIALKARSLNLDLPTLPLTTPVIAQLQASNGECWEATYDSLVIRNEGTRFTAKSD